MDHKLEDKSLIRSYLLGDLAEAERQVIEQRMITADEFYNQVLLAEDELVEEYALGRLTGKDKERFEASFLSTPEGREHVKLTADLIRYASEQSVEKPQAVGGRSKAARWNWSFFFNSSLGLLAAAVIILAAGLGIWRGFFYESDLDKGAAALRAAYRVNRPVEARLTGFDYAPAITTRGGQESVDSITRDRAARILLDEAAEHPTAASRHALGQLYLAEKRFDDSIRELEEALKADERNARAHSDLGAALLEKGKLERSRDELARSGEEFAKSLEHLNRALELNDGLTEALFNRALLYQETERFSQAEDDWRKYLERDSNSQWADEARRNLRILEEQKKKG